MRKLISILPHGEPRLVNTIGLRRVLRFLFEHKSFKKILGSNIALMVVATSFVPRGVSGTFSEEPREVYQPVIAASAPLKTERATIFPVAKIKITQGYRFFHPGVDLDGKTGDPVFAIKKGHVTYVQYSRFAYGNALIVDHGDGLTTLYAHFSKIFVKEGEEVTTATVLGAMGSTGRSTGDHLHFEARKFDRPINPFTILPPFK